MNKFKLVILSSVVLGVLTVSLFFMYASTNVDMMSSRVLNGNNKVKIGVVLPFTGDASDFGFDVKHGIELSKKEAGADNIELIYEDGSCDEVKSAEAIQRLIDQGVVAVIGELCSSATLAMTPYANEAQIPLVSPGATSPTLTQQGGEYFFRTIPSDIEQGKFAADLVYSEGYRELAIIYTDEAYGTDFKNILKNNFERIGGEVPLVQPIEREGTNIDEVVENIIDEEIEAVFIITNSPGLSANVIQNLKQEQPELQIFGGEGLYSEAVIQDIVSEAEGLIVTAVSSGESSFQKRFRIEYGSEIAPFSAQGYDAFTALYRSIDDHSEGKTIIDNMKIHGFRGVSGNIIFDENGDVEGNYNAYTVLDNDFVLLD